VRVYIGYLKSFKKLERYLKIGGKDMKKMSGLVWVIMMMVL
jgi:hypothetical protein